MFSESERVVIKHFPSGKIFVELNGVGYTFGSPDEMPPQIRAAYDRHLGVFGTRLGASLRGGDGYVHIEKHVFGLGGPKQIPKKEERLVIDMPQRPRIADRRGKRSDRGTKGGRGKRGKGRPRPVRVMRRLAKQPIRITRMEMCRSCGGQTRPVRSDSGKRCSACGARME